MCCAGMSSTEHLATRTSYPDGGPGRRRAPAGTGGASPILRFQTHAEVGTFSAKPEDPPPSWASLLSKVELVVQGDVNRRVAPALDARTARAEIGFQTDPQSIDGARVRTQQARRGAGMDVLRDFGPPKKVSPSPVSPASVWISMNGRFGNSPHVRCRSE